MAIRYVGNCEWEPKSKPDWTVDSWGVDRARWVWTGRADKLDAFVRTISAFATMPAFGAIPANKGVRLVEYSEANSSKPYLPEIELSYAGFRNGRIPPPKAVNSFSSQTAQGEGVETVSIDVDGSPVFPTASGTIQYRASRTTWTWFETSKPADTPRYAVVQNPLNPFDNITRMNLTRTPANSGGGSGPANSVPFSTLAAVFRSLVPAVVVNDYTREPILPDALWACSSTVDYVLLS